MEAKIKYLEEFDECFRMPEEMFPPLSAYRFKPQSILIAGLYSETNIYTSGTPYI